MIEIPTVFVLGAGASFDFGFPLGPALKLKLQSRDSELSRLFQTTNHRPETLAGFQRDLSYGGAITIDEFLMRRGDYAEIAKLAIAYHIGGCERDSRLQNTNPPHWFQRLFTRLIEGIETPEQFAAKNKVAVITFNYDRSFERSLWLGLQSIFPLHKYSAFEVARAHQAIKVTHVHGHLGDLPEIAQFSNGVFVRPRQYHGPTDVNDFAMAAGGIKVVSEINDNPAEFTEAQRMLSDANVVVFLGYGFDPTNNAHLSFKKMQRDANIHACTRGMHRGTWKGLRTTFQRITGHEPITEIQHPAAGFMAHILPILK